MNEGNLMGLIRQAYLAHITNKKSRTEDRQEIPPISLNRDIYYHLPYIHISQQSISSYYNT